MLSQQQFKSIIPLWNWKWHALVMGFLVLLITFGGVITARILLEGHFYLGPWPAFYLGDTDRPEIFHLALAISRRSETHEKYR